VCVVGIRLDLFVRDVFIDFIQ